MRYLGGKSRAAKHIVAEIIKHSGDRTRWVEPFVGGAAVAEIASGHFDELVLSDVHEDLVLMWQAALSGTVFPSDVSEDDYSAQRYAPPSALRGFVGYQGSFGG